MSMQAKLEAEMRDLGVARYRRQLTAARQMDAETFTPAGRRLVENAIPEMSSAIVAWIAQASKVAGHRHRCLDYIGKFEPDRVANVTAKVIVDGIAAYRTINSLCVAVGRALEDEDKLVFLQREHAGLFRTLNRKIVNQPTEASRAGFLKKAAKFSGIDLPIWPARDRAAVGLVLIELFRRHTGLIDIANRKNILGKDVTLVRGSDELMRWLAKSHEASEALRPVYMPMIEPPRNWTATHGGGYVGTEFMLKPLVKSVPRRVLKTLDDQGIPEVLAAVNRLQRTAWRVDGFVLDAVKGAWERGLSIGELPPKEPRLPPPKPEDIATNREARRAWSKKAARIHLQNEHERSKQIAVAKTVWVAEKYLNRDIFFPQELDFRGRIYPRPVFLQAQGADWQRGMLTFARGEPLDDGGMRWLHIHGANCWGNDKVSFDDRIAWTEEYAPMIFRCAEDPWANQEWQGADKPFSFLGFCKAFARAHENPGDPCGLPVYIDGSNNGLQLFSLMMRDEVSARGTNCVATERPLDIYTEVASRVIERLRAMLDPLAERWLAIGIERATVKRPVMCLPYGLTPYSARRYIREWYLERIRDNNLQHLAFPNDSYSELVFLTRVVWDAIGERVGAARACMDWLRQCARIHVDAGLPIQWTTPTGWFVRQAYGKLKVINVKTAIGSSYRQHRIADETDILSRSRNMNAISPNYVHSWDASVLVTGLNKAAERGITSFAGVHDAVATIPNQVTAMSESIRGAAYDLFSGDVLEGTRREFEAFTGLSFPNPPPQGSLDVSGIIDAEYFFA